MPKKTLATMTALVLVGALSSCSKDRGAPSSKPTASVRAEQCDPQLDAAFEAWEQAGFSGTVAVSSGGRFSCLAAYGVADDAAKTPHTVNTVFNIGSITKAVTAATVYDLAEDGKLAFDDRAGDLLPELTGPAAKVTINQLLLHTSGLNGSHGHDHQPLDRAAALAAINAMKPAFGPGTDYAYSNAGYTLLALIIEKVSGTGYREYTASKMLRLPGGRIAGGFWDGRPAATGPRAIGYLDDGRTGESGDFAGPHWALDGNGGLSMSAGDLAAWTHALFTGQLVSAESARAISTPGYDHGEGQAETPGWVAHDASRYGEPFLATAGGGGDVGHSAVALWVPEKQQVIAIASNKPKVSAEQLLKKVAPALLAGTPIPAPSRPTGGGQASKATAGTYTLNTGGTFDVTPAGNEITIKAHGADAITRLFPPNGSAQAADFKAMEQRVLALLDGKTDEGRKERASLEDTFGAIRKTTLAGTMFHDGDIRTYVNLTAGTASVAGWYSVDPQGGIIAADVPTKPPALTFTAAGRDRYRPNDPIDAGPKVTVKLKDGTMTLFGPGGASVTATAS
ncbi:serine hydrolase domain-containing protein [Streptomyces zagrosensis]|uniref:CubicO group peptidase (Beta-lactamase class C family) n=1 Tax=Streptomyces zagrosensis TaxID=1042984 RepID=A0A7W9QGR9_9ACTN|nr:serine hydrolase domain-containing protein [Streptomyces zagrosensis]MBB5938737.1 CubicO group peptidase (beta-lactamase class C family) [Streptomyces zagrosensis]